MLTMMKAAFEYRDDWGAEFGKETLRAAAELAMGTWLGGEPGRIIMWMVKYAAPGT